MSTAPTDLSPAALDFVTARHLATLTTLRPDGTPHVVPVGATFDPETLTARVISSRTSRKVRNVVEAGPDGARVALCQVDRARWATLEGVATVSQDPDKVAEGVARYTERYRPPRVNPDRVVIEIRVDRALGRA